MLKNGIKFAVVILLLLCLVAVPVFGVSFYDSPSIFSQNVFSTNRQLGNGTSAYLKFSEETASDELEAAVEEEEIPAAEETETETETATVEEETETAEAEDAALNAEPVETSETKTDLSQLTKEDYQKAADAIAARFKAIGYSDIVAEPVENDQIRVDIAQTSFIDSVMSQVACKGEWSLIDPSMNVVCDGSMVEKATVRTSSGGYYIRLDFTEEGAEQFKTNCASLAASSSSIYFYVDDSFTSIASLSNISFGKTFTFGSYGDYGFSDYGAAALYCAMINEGALPASMEVVSTEALAPTTPAAVITGICIAFAAVFVIFCLLFILQGRTVGLFAAGALLGDVGLMLTFMANGAFQVNLATVITLFICLILAGIFFLFTVKPYGKALKEGKSIGPVLSGPTKKMNIRALWIHALIFAVTILIWMFAQGAIIYVVRAVMVASLINLGTYFALIIFPAYTLAETQKQKK